MYLQHLTRSGFPHLLAFLLLAVAIYFTEQRLSSVAETPTSIKIEVDTQSVSETGDVTPVNEAPPDPELMELAGQLIDEHQDLQTIVGLPTFASQPAEGRQKLLSALGDLFFESGNYEQAVNSFKEIDSERRQQLNMQFRYAYSLSRIGQSEPAIKEYNSLIASNPNSQSGHINLGLLLKKRKQCSLAKPIFEKAVDITSGLRKAKSLFNLAQCEFRMGEFDGAVDHFSKAIEYRPGHKAAWIELALSMQARGDAYLDTLDVFDKGVSLDANSYKTLLSKSKFQIRNLDFPGAVETLKQAIQISDDPRAHVLMAWSYLELGKRSNARRHLKKLEQLTSNKVQKKESELLTLYANKHYRQVINRIPLSKKLPANLAYLKGLAYRRLGLFKNALASFERAASNDSQFEFRVRLQQARILRSRKHYTDGADVFDALIQHNPQVAFLWFENALTHESHQLFEDAKKRILKALELQPKNRVYRLVYARVLNSLGEAAQALKIIDEVIARHPRYKRAWRLSIQVLENLDQQDKLNRAYTKLLELDPGNTEYSIAWSKVLIQQRQSPQAISLLESVVEAHSNHTYARYLLAQATYIDGNASNSLKQLEDILKLEPEFKPALDLKKQITVTLKTKG